MNKNNFFKLLGVTGALFLIIFGNIGNFWRTVTVAWQKTEKNK